ncbi:MAG: hypothetical protein D6706_17600 [Chloroflexi bacterium]|nr:MAG: hypothetical protein D6706_17600 [Chloroflexota bacterium]
MSLFEQDRFIVRLQQRVLAESKIVACFLAGSYGRRKEDDFSDLDVALVFANESDRENTWMERRAFVQSVLPYVPAKSFDAVHIRPFFHIALYSNGAKVDYRFETQSSLEPNPWDSEIRILKDSDKWAENYQAMCARTLLPQPRLTTEELIHLDERFWVMFWDVFRLLLRGDHDKPFTVYLELLHFTLPPLLRVLPPEEPARRALLQATYQQDTRVTRQHLGQLLGAYLAARTAVVQRLDLAFTPHNTFESAVKRLVERWARVD